MPGLPQGKLLGSEEVQANISSRFDQACMELMAKGERQRAEKAAKEAEERKIAAKEAAKAPIRERLEFMKNHEAGYSLDSADQRDDEEEEDALLEESNELDLLRQRRLEQLKKKKEEHMNNLSKGHGEYVEVFEDAFQKIDQLELLPVCQSVGHVGGLDSHQLVRLAHERGRVRRRPQQRRTLIVRRWFLLNETVALHTDHKGANRCALNAQRFPQLRDGHVVLVPKRAEEVIGPWRKPQASKRGVSAPHRLPRDVRAEVVNPPTI
jgi:hypothetical protein